MSNDIENQQITSAKYTVLMLRLYQNERYRAFGMVAARTSVIHAAKLIGCSSSPKKNVKIRAYSEPLIREIAEKQIRWVIDNS